ncbi:hypothetical protein CcI49_08745 [Frankia sp. CcI49]|nr:hypothetical protein CcI49_08745 [Frankia sp. CcI49]
MPAPGRSESLRPPSAARCVGRSGEGHEARSAAPGVSDGLFTGDCAAAPLPTDVAGGRSAPAGFPDSPLEPAGRAPEAPDPPPAPGEAGAAVRRSGGVADAGGLFAPAARVGAAEAPDGDAPCFPTPSGAAGRAGAAG